uniref:opioid growth factor receptor-like protein 1 isoform X2 n=1 Tax=Pristiophorus japonicus TaxID=55135 RepID=UPI00398EC7C2
MLEDKDYDSTWTESEGEPDQEPEPEQEQPQDKGAMLLGNAEDHRETGSGPAEKRKFLDYDKPYRSRNKRAAKDLQRYRHGYPDLSDKRNDDVNFRFYTNKMSCWPDDWTIEEMITDWRGNYDLLERNHSYIQWLFPLREPGMNWHAKELTRSEIKLFRENKDVKRRLIKAYRMMLDFYGIELVNQKSGEVKRARHWKDRFYNLNLHTHNNLRITRILKCLGEMGFEHYQAPLVKFFLTETLINKQLPRVKESVLDYFLYTIRSKSERRKLILYAQQHYRPLVGFVWGPPKGTEQRFSHILEELKKEEVNVQEPASEEASDEDMPAEDEIKRAPSEAAEGSNLKLGSLTNQRSSDSMEKSANCVKDSEERSEDHIETRTLDAATSQEQCSAEEKSHGDRKSPVSENKSDQNGNIEKQTECEEEVVAEGSKPNIEEQVQGSDVLKNCETEHKEKTEDDLEKLEGQLPVMASEATRLKETDWEGKLPPSIEPEPVTSEEDKPTAERKIRIEVAGETDETTEGGLATTEEDNLATEGSKIGNTGTTETNEIAHSHPVTREEDKCVKEEDMITFPVMGGQKNVSTEIHEGQNKSVSKRKIQSSTKDEGEHVEDMEIQEASLPSTIEVVKDSGEKGGEMEEDDVPMEDGQ